MMTRLAPLDRPAIAAIAAVLALSTSPALAQAVDPATTLDAANPPPVVTPAAPPAADPAPAGTDPIVAPEPAPGNPAPGQTGVQFPTAQTPTAQVPTAQAPTAQLPTRQIPAAQPPMSATAPVDAPANANGARIVMDRSAGPVVQDLPPESVAADDAANAAKARREATAERTATMSAERTGATEKPDQTGAASAPLPASPQSAADAAGTADMALPTLAPAMPDAPPPAAVTAESARDADGATPWLVGGGALLLLGGAVALALGQRRSRPENLQRTPIETVPPQREAPVTPVANVRPAAVPSPAPVVATGPAEAPIAATQVDAIPVAPPRPIQDRVDIGRDARLEAMVAAPPSPENPFLTRRNRLRRATYILTHDSAPESLRSPQPAMAPAAEPDVRAATQRRAPQAPADAPVGQPVHRFGPDRPSRPLWKPVTR